MAIGSVTPPRLMEISLPVFEIKNYETIMHVLHSMLNVSSSYSEH